MLQIPVLLLCERIKCSENEKPSLLFSFLIVDFVGYNVCLQDEIFLCGYLYNKKATSFDYAKYNFESQWHPPNQSCTLS